MTNKAKRRVFPADLMIIGFTGALGSGCSFFAKQVAKQCNYFCIELSKYIGWKS